jgi:ADP-ribose pyrophosphatase YjhB (NUDIX family)
MRKGFDYVGVTTVTICHDGKGNYVLHKRSNVCRDEHGKWDCGGGGLEFGLSVEENLRKEIKEEYCTDVLELEFLGFRDVHREHNGEKTHWIALDYKVLVDPFKVKIGEPEKAVELGWFKLSEFPKDLHSQFPLFLDNYMGNL